MDNKITIIKSSNDNNKTRTIIKSSNNYVKSSNNYIKKINNIYYKIQLSE